VEKLSGTLVTIAKDVKIQVEFNPGRVAAYRLIGYENRALAAQDFNDDRKDAGEIGAGHTVTALYEIVPTGLAVPAGSVDTLRYQTDAAAQEPVAPAAVSVVPPAHADELLLVKLRYKQPEGDTSQLLEFPLKDQKVDSMSAGLRFASAVAAFGKLLRGDPLGPALSYDGMIGLVQQAGALDPGYSMEIISLMQQARPMLDVHSNAAGTAGVSLLQIRDAGNGVYLARIRTVHDAWYREGVQFEEYTLLDIRPEVGCVTIFSEREQRSFDICVQ
jgi:Ca-activated chloride channel family protein